LAAFIVAKFLERDRSYQRADKLGRARRRTRIFAEVWLEMLSRDVWTDTASHAAVCETASRWKPGLLVLPATALGALGVVVWLALINGVEAAVAAALIGVVALIPLLPRVAQERELSKRHRRGAKVLTCLASRRPGAGRDLVEARCVVADAQAVWLCLDAPEKLRGYYEALGFVVEGEPIDVSGKRRLYMERKPPRSTGR